MSVIIQGPVSGLSDADQAYIDLAQATVPDASKLVNSDNLGTAALAATGDFDAAGAAATAVSDHETTYDHDNIPSVDEASALAAYQSALAGAAAGQVLTASGPGTAGFAAVNAGPRIYAAVLSQSGTSAPVATVMGNTIGTPTWTRLNTGRYKLQFSGVVLDGTKTLILWSSYVGGAPFFLTFDVGISIGSLLISVWDSAGNYTDDLLIGQIKVEAYQTF